MYHAFIIWHSSGARLNHYKVLVAVAVHRCRKRILFYSNKKKEEPTIKMGNV